MPSGAKKRKSAKKKKEYQTEFHTNPSTTNHPQGNDDLKSHSQDEKGSDGGEGDSSSHGDHDHSFNEGVEEAEEIDPSGVRPFASVERPLEGNTSNVKIGEAEGGKESAVVIEWDLNAEESSEIKDASVVHNESAKEFDHENGNSGGSKNKTEAAKNLKNEPDNSIKETVALDEPVESVDSSHCKVTLIAQNVTAEDTGNSVVETSTDPEVKSTDTGNALLENSTGSQVGESDLDVKKNEDKLIPFFDQNVRTSSLEEHKPKDFDNIVSASVSHSSIPEHTNGAKNVKQSDAPESSGNQPLVPSGPQVVQKSSWLSCCGLFELLSGSNG